MRSRATRSLCVTIAACLLALVLVLAIGERHAIEARGAPHRNDRRPDRETRIRYPRTRSSSSNNPTNNSRTLRGTASPPANSITPPDQSPASTPAPSAQPADR